MNSSSPSTEKSEAPAAPATGPLAEANPQSLERFFSMDPLKMQRQDRDVIVRELRAMREKWIAGGARATDPTPKKPRPSKSNITPEALAAAEDILKDIGL